MQQVKSFYQRFAQLHKQKSACNECCTIKICVWQLQFPSGNCGKKGWAVWKRRLPIGMRTYVVYILFYFQCAANMFVFCAFCVFVCIFLCGFWGGIAQHILFNVLHQSNNCIFARVFFPIGRSEMVRSHLSQLSSTLSMWYFEIQAANS